MSSLRNAISRRNHKERAQPYERQKYGVLEKHKDYVARAQDYHSKEKRLKVLKEKALGRNEDEFYFGMMSTKTRGGVHQQSRGETPIDIETAKILKAQDVNYIKTQRQINLNKVNRLKQELQMPEEGQKLTKKIIFVDEDEVPEDILATEKTSLPTLSAQDTVLDKERKRKLAELNARMARETALSKAEKEINVQRSLMGKGRRQKLGKDKHGVAVYKWKTERKK